MISTLFAAAAVAGAAQATAVPRAPDYTMHRAWLCLPTRVTACSKPLPTTALNTNGYGSTGLSTVAEKPPVDCFYVYPTVSRDVGLNSDLIAGRDEEFTAEAHVARFSSVCQVFAPIYRQMTVASIAAYATGTDVTQAGRIAYGDVRDAFRQYLKSRSFGRPFVLIGHSQGSLMLQQLIAEEIETVPALRKRMLLAILPGYNLLVPRGRLVGGTLKRTPLCSRPGETGCVLSWVSFRERNVPPAGAIFGYADKLGMTVACTNPARPGSAAWERLDSYWYARSGQAVAGGPIAWSSEGAPPSPYLRTEGLVSGRCVNDGPRGYLSVRTNADPRDNRTDRIGGEVAVLGMFLPGWGMHPADMAIAQGDLIRQVDDLAEGEPKR